MLIGQNWSGNGQTSSCKNALAGVRQGLFWDHYCF